MRVLEENSESSESDYSGVVLESSAIEFSVAPKVDIHSNFMTVNLDLPGNILVGEEESSNTQLAATAPIQPRSVSEINLYKNTQGVTKGSGIAASSTSSVATGAMVAGGMFGGTTFLLR